MSDQLETAYTYIFVRRDLSGPQRIIQVAHAVHEAALGSAIIYEGPTPHVVLFVLDDEAALINVSRKIPSAGIVCWAFYEPDNNLGFTALATQPVKDVALRELVFGGSQFELLAE